MSRRFVAAAIAAALALAAAAASAAPRSELWPRWTAHDPASEIAVDHSPWDAFLETYVVPRAEGANRVDYAGVTAADRGALERYVAALEEVGVSRLARPQQLVYWINLYNAVTVRTILAHYPVGTIRDIGISPGLFSRGPWGAKLVTVENEQLSLDDIEHRILRPIWQDPRIHYAVNCAALGCPDLIPRAYRAGDVDAVLDANARAFVNDARGVRLDGGALVVSSIYAWFQEDFGGSEAGVLAHLKRYADADTAALLEGRDGYDDHAYDWSLNGVRRPGN